MRVFEEVFPATIPFLFIGMWCFVLRTLASMSGWTTLAERFHYSGKFQGKHYRFQSARLGPVNFSGSLEFGVNETGLYLIPMIFFRLYHKPLLIPWREIQTEQFKKLFFKGYRLTFKSFTYINLEMSNRTFAKLQDYLKD